MGTCSFKDSVECRRLIAEPKPKVPVIEDPAEFQITNVDLGEGRYGKVKLAHKISDPSCRAAVKIQQRNADKQALDDYRNEVDILSHLNHKSIVRMLCSVETENLLYIYTEYCEGGDLFDRVQGRKMPFSEEEASEIIK